MAVKYDLNREEVRLRLKMLQDENVFSGDSQGNLRALLAEAAAPGEDLAWLAAHDLDPDISAGAFTALYFALRNEGIEDTFRDQVRAGAAPVLFKALRSPRMPDSRKYAIGPLYTFCVGQVSGEEYRGFFSDFDGITSRMINEAIQNLAGAPRSVDRVLTGMEALLETESDNGSRFSAAMELAEHMLEKKPDAAAALCGAALVVGWLDEDVRDSRADIALRFLESTSQPRALWLLDEMARWPGLNQLRAKARRAAQKMELKGIRPDYPVDTTFSHGLLTAPDGLGSRQMALFYNTPEGRMDALLLLYNESVGIKDVMCIFDDGLEVKEELHARAGGLAMAPCNLRLAREFLGDGLARHGEAGTAPPANLIIYRPYLGAAPIMPRRRMPDLSIYGLTVLNRTPELVSDSERLAASPFYGMFMFTSDKAYAYFQKNTAKKRCDHLARRTLDRFLREVAIEERETLLGRMAATLEVESLAGRARNSINQTAARTWLGISREVLPFDQVPYVQAVGRMSADMIIENIQMGFQSQGEVNEAALRAEKRK